MVTQTLDPFSGVVYARPASSFREPKRASGSVGGGCRAQGRGGHTVKLAVPAGSCGWRREGQLVRLDLYVQYDTHVQQVVDEQLTVECDLSSGEGRVVSQGSRQAAGGVGVVVQASQSVLVDHKQSVLVGQGFAARTGQVDQEEESREGVSTEGWRATQEVPQEVVVLEEVVVGTRKKEAFYSHVAMLLTFVLYV